MIFFKKKERKLYCAWCGEELVESDASHMLFNKDAKIKKNFISCRNKHCYESKYIKALIEVRK